MTDRTVTSTLVLRIREYVSDARSAKAATAGITEELVDAGKATDKLAAGATVAGKATDKLGDEMREAARDAARLDREIDGLTSSVLRLAKQYAATGDKSIFKQMRSEQADLRRALNVKKLMGDSGDDGGRSFYASLVARLGPLMARMPIGPWIVPAVVAAGPTIAATIGAAVSGGVALVGIGGGLAIAAQDPKVKASAAVLGEDIGQILGRSAQAFVPATLRGLDKIRAGFRSMEPDLTAIFSKGAGNFDRLIDSAIDGTEKLVHSLRNVSDNAGPVVDVLGEHLSAALATSGDALERMGRNTEYASSTLDGLLTTVELTITGTAGLVEGMNELADAGFFGVGALQLLGAASSDSAEAADTAGTNHKRFSEHLRELQEEAVTGAERIEQLKQAFDELFDSQMSIDRASDRAKEGMHDLNVELTHGKRTLSQNTEEGRRNRGAVLDQIQAIKNLRDARIRHGMSLDQANAKYSRDVAGLRRAALAAGFNKAQVDALIGSYRRMPTAVNVKVGVTGVGPSANELARLRRYIASVPRYIAIHAQVTSSGNVHVPGGTILRREGGITEHAQTGLLREATTFTTRDPARFAFAEPATGGEAFIPKRGNYARSMGILDKAAGWYGAKVSPARGAAGSSVAVTGSLRWDGPSGPAGDLGRVLMRFLRLEIRGQQGGNVQATLGRGT